MTDLEFRQGGNGQELVSPCGILDFTKESELLRL